MQRNAKTKRAIACAIVVCVGACVLALCGCDGSAKYAGQQADPTITTVTVIITVIFFVVSIYNEKEELSRERARRMPTEVPPDSLEREPLPDDPRYASLAERKISPTTSLKHKDCVIPTRIVRFEQGVRTVEEFRFDLGMLVGGRRRTEGSPTERFKYVRDKYGHLMRVLRDDEVVKEFELQKETFFGSPRVIRERCPVASDIVFEGGTAEYEIEWNDEYKNTRLAPVRITKRSYLPKTGEEGADVAENTEPFVTMTVVWSEFGRVLEKSVVFQKDNPLGVQTHDLHQTFEYEMAPSGKMTKCIRTDEDGNRVEYTPEYTESGKIKKMIERGVQVVYEYDDEGNLQMRNEEYECVTEYTYQTVSLDWRQQVMYNLHYGIMQLNDPDFGLDW